MQHIGVAIVYLMLGAVTFRFAEKLQLRTTQISLSIGKSLYVSGWIIFFASVSTLLPIIPNFTATIVLALTVTVMSVLTLKNVKRLTDMLKYDSRFFIETIEHKNKEDFDTVYHKYPELIFTKAVIKRLAENGLLGEWMDKYQAAFDKKESELFRSYLLLDVMNKQDN